MDGRLYGAGRSHPIDLKHTPAPLQDLVLIPNATTGLNIVISSVFHGLKRGDRVSSLDIG